MESKNLRIWTAHDRKLNCRGSRIALVLASICIAFSSVSSATFLRNILWLEANVGKAGRHGDGAVIALRFHQLSWAC